MFFIFGGVLKQIEVGTQSTKVLVEMAAHMKISLDPQCAGVPTWTSKWVLQVTVVSLVSPWGNTHCCFVCESIGHGWHFHAFPWWSSFDSWPLQLFRYVLTRPQGSGSQGLGPGSDVWGWDHRGWQLHSWSSFRGRRGRGMGWESFAVSWDEMNVSCPGTFMMTGQFMTMTLLKNENHECTWYPLVNIRKTMETCHLYIVSFPIKNGDFP